MSACIDMCDPPNEVAFWREIDAFLDDPAAAARLDLHVVVCDAYKRDSRMRSTSRASNAYPVNLLRNVGIRAARTDFVMVLDVDFLVDPNARSVLSRALPLLDTHPSSVLVLPAFETLDVATPLPSGKEALLRAWSSGLVLPVHLHFEYAHGATNYSRWRTAASPYVVRYEYMFEPYFVMRVPGRSSGSIGNESTTLLPPLYDLRFTGYGHDKAEHAFELAAAGFDFVVLPDTFLVHMFHPPAAWRDTQDLAAAWTRWWGFVEDMYLRYGFSAPLPVWLTKWLDTVPCWYPQQGTGHHHANQQDYAQIPHDRCQSARARVRPAGVASSGPSPPREPPPRPVASPLSVTLPPAPRISQGASSSTAPRPRSALVARLIGAARG